MPERDCALTRDLSWDPGNGDFNDCRNGSPSFEWQELPQTEVDAWKKLGQGFVKVGVGGQLHVSGPVSATAGLDALYLLPATGVALEPSLGVVLAL